MDILNFKISNENIDDSDDTEILELPKIDNILKNNGKDLSGEALTAIVEMTLTPIYNNFGATIEAIHHILALKDDKYQYEIIDIFDNACEYYDAGHRLWEDTVQDQLLDDIFPNFNSGPLAKLLDGLSDKGDGMDSLFAPALSTNRDNNLNEKIEKELLDILEEYYKKLNSYLGAEYWDDLIKDIKKNASECTKKRIDILRTNS